MAIKVQLTPKNYPKLYTYPALYIDEQEGLLLLLTGPGTGTVMSSGRSNYQVGYVGQYWKMERLVPFIGSLTLENEAK